MSKKKSRKREKGLVEKKDSSNAISSRQYFGRKLQFILNFLGDRQGTSDEKYVDLLKKRKLTVAELMEQLKFILDEIEYVQELAEIIWQRDPEPAAEKAKEVWAVLEKIAGRLAHAYELIGYTKSKKNVNLRQLYSDWVRGFSQAYKHCEKLEDLATWFLSEDKHVGEGDKQIQKTGYIQTGDENKKLWTKPMTKSKMMTAVGLDSYRALDALFKGHEIKHLSRKLHQVRVDQIDIRTREKLLKA